MLGGASTVLAASGCDGLLGPAPLSARYVLTTMGDAPAPTVNILEHFLSGDAAEGAYWYIVADTLLFYADGRGERRGAFRYRPRPGTPVTTNFEPYVEFRGEFRWSERRGSLQLTYLTDCSRYCFAGYAERELRRVRWGALQRDWEVHAMHYEPVSSSTH